MTDKQYIEALTKIIKYLLGYSEDQKLSKFMYLRLRGLNQGKTVANNHIKATANYSYEEVINTFRLFKYDIDNTLASVKTVDDNHKFNLILTVVDKHLNDTVKVMQKQKEAEESTKNMNIDSLVHKQVEYKSSNEEVKESIKDNKLKDEMRGLW